MIRTQAGNLFKTDQQQRVETRSMWREVTIESIAAPTDNALTTGPFGSSIGSRLFQAEGIPVIRGSNLSDEIGTRLIEDNLVFVSPAAARQFERSKARRGDLVFTCWGTIGQVGLLDSRSRYEEYIISNKQMKLTPDPAQADSLFLYYLFSSPMVTGLIKAQAIGSSVPGFNLGQLKRMMLPLPPIEEQRAIAHILGTLDDKIYLLRRMSQTIEETLQTVFHSWFVYFDPIRATTAGQKPSGIDTKTARLFPKDFVNSPIGPIPKGWNISQVGDAVSVQGGSTPRTNVPEFWDGGTISWATPKDLSRLTSSVLLSTERQITDAGLSQISSGLLPAGTLLLSSRAPIGYLALTQIPVAVNQGFIAIPPGGRLSPIYMLCWARHHMEQIKSRAGGTTFPEISKGNFRSLPLLVPDSRLLQLFDEIARPYIMRIIANEESSRTLAALRDTMLPQLLSGASRAASATDS